MAGNVTASSHEKHLDIWYDYVNKYVRDVIVKILFLKSMDNISKHSHKNLSNELHGKHSNKMIGEKLK